MAVTRSLSSPSQILKREARRAQRAGFKTAAEQLYAKGAATGFEERMARSSNIRSAEEEIAAERETQRSTAASNLERAALLRQGGLSSAVTTSAPQRSTNASLNAALPDETATQYYARQRASRLETTPTAPTPTPTATVQSPAPATKPATPAIDYLDTSGSPMVEQTREEKDMVRREALQDAYDRLTNPSGEAGSMKEVSAQKVAATPAPPTTPTGPTMEELRAGLRESFDRRNAINSEASRKAEIASRPVVIGGVTMPAGYGVPATQAQKDFDAEQQRAARIMYQGPRTPVEDYVEPTPAPVQYKTSAGNPARVTGRLIRDVATGIGESAVRGPQIATEAAKDTVSGMLEGNRKILRGAKGLAKDAAVESLRTRREFLRGLQGQ